MESGENVISAEALIRILIVMLYMPVCLLAYWRLVPRLSPASKCLVSFMLVAQGLVIGMSLVIRPTSGFERWFWDLNQEANIPATLASTQLALVSIVALVRALLARARPTWHRLYLAGIGLLFLFFALDEFFKIHEVIRNWEIYYALLGALVVAATMVVVARSPRLTWIWHICLLAGLALSGTGAIVIEQLRAPEICDSLGFSIEGRCQLYNIEESLEFLGIWLTLIAVLGLFSGAVARLRPLVRSYLIFLPFLWILAISPSALIAFLEFRLLYEPALVQYESDVELQAYRIDQEEGALVLQLFASSDNWHDYTGLGYSVHLVDQITGVSIAGTDEPASRQHRWRISGRSYYFWMFKQRIVVHIPPQTPTNRALWVVLTLWRREGDEFVHQNIMASDRALLTETQAVMGELVLPTEPIVSSSIPVAVFENGFTLDAVGMPARTQTDATMSISFAWRTDKDGSENYVQFLHLGNVQSGSWWVHDQQPLGPRLPTRLWYSGLADIEIWEIPLPADLAPGRYNVLTGLYSPLDQERLPASDAKGVPFRDDRIPLGVLTIEGA